MPLSTKLFPFFFTYFFFIEGLWKGLRTGTIVLNLTSLTMLTPWKESYEQPRQHTKKQRRYFANKGQSSQGYGFSTGHVWMWELDYKESWMQKNWCFWTVVLERLLIVAWTARRSVLGVHWKEWCWSWNSNTLPDVRSWLIGKDPDAGKDWGQDEKGTTEDEMVGWHHQLDGHGFGWTPGVGDGQGGLVCCGSWGRKESDMTERLNWTELCFWVWTRKYSHIWWTSLIIN